MGSERKAMEWISSSRLDATPLDAIQPFTQNLAEIVHEMQNQLATEMRILEGTEIPAREEITIPPPEDPEAVLRELTGQNELSESETKECQWSNASANGCWTTDPIPGSTLESSSSACIAELFSRNCPIRQSSDLSSSPSMNCSEGKLESCGCETDATNGSCACMEQTINVPMAGTLSEEK
jgi:hypothetical protein